MDSKIKLFTILACTLCSLFLPSCKKNNWLEWKVQNEMWLEANKTSTIVCDYSVKLINGYRVDGGNAVSLSLANTIPGFQEGCHHIHNNGDIELYIPAYLGYDYAKYQSDEYSEAEGLGTEGTQGFIPPYSTLIYTIHICGVTGE